MDEYPNQSDAWYPETPAPQVEKENKEKARVSSSIAVIQDVLDWFRANADLYSSVDSLGIDDATPAIDAKVAALLSKKMRVSFLSKEATFRAEFGKYLKEEQPK